MQSWAHSRSSGPAQPSRTQATSSQHSGLRKQAFICSGHERAEQVGHSSMTPAGSEHSPPLLVLQ